MADQVIILLVCTANVCRSPTAEILLNSALASSGFGHVVRATSAGVDAEPGQPMCAQLGDQVGPDAERHAARHLTSADLGGASLVLALDRTHRSACARLEPACRPRLFTLRQASLLAEGLRAVLVGGETPVGSPPLPTDPVARLRWFVAELDAARGSLAGRSDGELDIVDRHGREPHGDVAGEIEDSVRRLSDAMDVVLAAGQG